MFGGFGIFRDGLMFALLADEVLYFKTDEACAHKFEARGLRPFRYEARGKVNLLRYHEAPPEAYEDAQAMAIWAREGWDCALRARRPAAGSAGKPAARGASGRRGVEQPSPSWRVGTKPPAAPSDLAALDYLGPRSVEMLGLAGIRSQAQLRELGSVVAYARTKAVCPQVTLNLLWALEGALSQRPWQEVAEHDRASLLMALEDVQRHQAG